MLLADNYVTGDADVNTCDHSHDVPKPLLVAVGELGEVGMPATDLLKKHGAAINNYFGTSLKP